MSEVLALWGRRHLGRCIILCAVVRWLILHAIVVGVFRLILSSHWWGRMDVISMLPMLTKTLQSWRRQLTVIWWLVMKVSHKVIHTHGIGGRGVDSRSWWCIAWIRQIYFCSQIQWLWKFNHGGAWIHIMRKHDRIWTQCMETIFFHHHVWRAIVPACINFLKLHSSILKPNFHLIVKDTHNIKL